MPSTITCTYHGPAAALPQIAEELGGRADSVLGQQRLSRPPIQAIDGASAGIHTIALVMSDDIGEDRVRAVLRACINMQGRSPNLNVAALDGGVGDDGAAGTARYELSGTHAHKAGEALAHYA